MDTITIPSSHEIFYSRLRSGWRIQEAADAAALRLLTPDQAKRYYVYLLVDPRTDVPFYVGKGRGGRCFAHMQGSAPGRPGRKGRRIQEILAAGERVDIWLLADDLGEDAAFLLERQAIQGIGYKMLTNVMPGIMPPHRRLWFTAVRLLLETSSLEIAKMRGEIDGIPEWVTLYTNELRRIVNDRRPSDLPADSFRRIVYAIRHNQIGTRAGGAAA